MRHITASKILSKVVADYDKINDEFDKTRRFPGKEFKYFDPYIRNNPCILDLGCGNGRLLKYIESLDKKDTGDIIFKGIDNNNNLIDKATKAFSHIRYANFKKGDQLNIPLADKSIDIIFNIRAFHHIPSKKMRLKAIVEMKRVLKDNGIVIITVWNLWQKKYAYALLKALLRFLITIGSYDINDTFIPWGKKTNRYYHAFLPSELKHLVMSEGFDIKELFYVKKGVKTGLMQSHDIVLIASKSKCEKK